MWQQASVSVFQRSALGSCDRQVLELRAQVAHVGQAELGGQLLAIVEGLAEQHAGVEEQHRDVGLDLRRPCAAAPPTPRRTRRPAPARRRSRRAPRAMIVCGCGVAQLARPAARPASRRVFAVIGHGRGSCLALDEGRLAAVGGALIDVAEAAARRGSSRPGVEPSAGSKASKPQRTMKPRLLAQHVAHRAHLALEAVALAQDPRPRNRPGPSRNLGNASATTAMRGRS